MSLVFEQERAATKDYFFFLLKNNKISTIFNEIFVLSFV